MYPKKLGGACRLLLPELGLKGRSRDRCARAQGRAMPGSSTLHVLQLLRELLAFVLLSYTVLLGALLLAGWTTYFLVLK
ncbi:uncharacterized LOC128125816 homolog isoform X1 [Ochotona princeps]|uniref:uncharacterized LOC128125816 homolog isoform X1 n=1 Tax=Ochotona princeps TaxID=9978 RepID=UPI002715266B|nr:uncharacterized LOC128125816 homolog isoform X1 [Ochotona princeps]